ncbi:MAG: S10 family serine carboxypeptidase-like protein, partial [Legionella sp.]
TAQGLTQIKLRAAGHMAPMDQPENTLDMMINYIHKTKKMLK